MFVEKLNHEQQKKIAKAILPKTAYRYQCTWYGDYIELFLYDKEKGNYPILIYDTYVYSPIYIKGLTEKVVKALYDIFGEEYKEYYLEKAKKLFE